MVNRTNGTRANDHRANGNRADVVVPEWDIRVFNIEYWLFLIVGLLGLI